MSRGMGVRQRELLRQVSAAGDAGLYVTSGLGPSDAASLRRAAYRLADDGFIQLRTRRGKLVAYPPDSELDPEYVIAGSDGRVYRTPRGTTRERLQRDREYAAWLDDVYQPMAMSHGHGLRPGVPLCLECAERSGAEDRLLRLIEAARQSEA